MANELLSLESMQSTGWTALFFAAKDGSVHVIQLLLQHKDCNPTVKDHVRTVCMPTVLALAENHQCLCVCMCVCACAYVHACNRWFGTCTV